MVRWLPLRCWLLETAGLVAERGVPILLGRSPPLISRLTRNGATGAGTATPSHEFDVNDDEDYLLQLAEGFATTAKEALNLISLGNAIATKTATAPAAIFYSGHEPRCATLRLL